MSEQAPEQEEQQPEQAETAVARPGAASGGGQAPPQGNDESGD